jgi:hypothetical protein
LQGLPGDGFVAMLAGLGAEAPPRFSPAAIVMFWQQFLNNPCATRPVAEIAYFPP